MHEEWLPLGEVLQDCGGLSVGLDDSVPGLEQFVLLLAVAGTEGGEAASGFLLLTNDGDDDPTGEGSKGDDEGDEDDDVGHDVLLFLLEGVFRSLS